MLRTQAQPLARPPPGQHRFTKATQDPRAPGLPDPKPRPPSPNKDPEEEEWVGAASLDPVLGGAVCVPRPFPGPSWQGLPLPARPAVTWPDDGFQQGDPSGQELQLSLLLQEAL